MEMKFEHIGKVGPIDFWRRSELGRIKNLYYSTKERDLIRTHWFALPTEAELADHLDLAPWEDLRQLRLTEIIN